MKIRWWKEKTSVCTNKSLGHWVRRALDRSTQRTLPEVDAIVQKKARGTARCLPSSRRERR